MEGDTESKRDHAPLDDLLKHLESPDMLSWMEEVIGELAFLKAFLMDPPQQFVEDGTLEKLESLASKAGSIISSFDLKNLGKEKNMVCEFRMALSSTLMRMWLWTYVAQSIYQKGSKPSRIYFSRTDQLGFVAHLVENLKELVKGKADSIGPLKLYILRLQWKLQLVNSRLMEIPEPQKKEADVKDLIESIAHLAYEVEYAIDTFLVRDIPLWYCMFWLRDILEEFKEKKGQVEMDVGDTQSIVNCIMNINTWELNIIPIVNNTKIGETLGEILDERAIIDAFDIRTRSLVSSYKERKEEVFRELQHNASFKSYRDHRDPITYAYYTGKDGSERSSYELLKRSLYELLKLKKYFIILEDVPDIDALSDIIRALPKNYNGSRILLTTRSPELAVQCRYGSQKGFSNKMSRDITSTSQINKPTTDDYVVGFKEETEKILERLIRGPRQLHIISIVGMAGQGKTTLAKNLYSDISVVSYFDTRAWCNVFQVYEKRDLLLELLGNLVQLSDTFRNKNNEELAEILYKHLKGRRFLIFLDDMWKIDAWNDLARCFPNDNNGSRIMFTTRIQELASRAKSDSILEPLSPLSDDESWALLKKKLFQKGSCPLELVEVGRQIAKNCKGLPLSIILTAGLLAKKEKKVDGWKQIADTLSSNLLGKAEEAQGKGVVELSYTHLQDHLKPCFLYFGAFLEDREVLVSKLIRLWIAEGFIKHTDLKSLEDVAEDYLTDLIGRSLVTIARERSNDGVKSCRVHDLLQEFCLIKAKEENFMQPIRGYDEHFPSNDNLDHGLDPNYSYSSTPIIYHLRRLCIYSKRNHFIMLKPSGPLVRSLLFFAGSDMSPSYSYDISFISHNFKLLRILDLEGINIGDSFSEILVLIHLKYLAVQGFIGAIPSSVANLWSLETFCVKALKAKVVKVPDSIWDMTNLRHVRINECASFDLDPHRLESSSILDNLQTFSTPSLAYGDDMEKIMRRLRGIRKLKCIFLDSLDDVRNCNQFPVLGFLNHLVSLKVFYNGMGKYPCEFNFPSNLKKLTLSNFCMPWHEISQFAKLCNLETLKLLCKASEGERWVMEDEVFQKLKFLKLDTLNLVEWSATCDHFPHLESLLLHNCKELEEIPPGIGAIPTLQMIELMWCNPSAAISAKKIQEEQLDFGNEGLKIHVRPNVWDLESSS